MPLLSGRVAAVGGALIVAAPLLLVLPSLPWHLPAAVAWADDDGGGDDGGDGGGDGGGRGRGGDSDSGGDDDGGGGDGGPDGDNDDSDDDSGLGGGDDDGDEGSDDESDGGADARGEGGRDFVPNELLVANLRKEGREDIRHLGFVLLEERSFSALGLSVARLRVPRYLTTAAARRLLATSIPGLLVDVNALYRLRGQRVLPAPDYARRLIGWGRGAVRCGTGLRIGLVDTRIDTGLPALQHARIEQRSFLSNSARPAPRDHGTALAAILVGSGDSRGEQGLLPGARLLAAEVVAADDDGAPAADLLALSEGLNWLVSEKVPVINLSLSGAANALLTLAVERVAASGTVLVAAAGNDGPAAPPAFPAAAPGVVAVTAIDSASQPYEQANRGDYIDFAAPGVQVWTPGTDGFGQYNTGTSYAAPFVVAAITAQLRAGRPTHAGRVTAALARTAIDLGAPGRDRVFGWGLVQAANPCGAAPAESE